MPDTSINANAQARPPLRVGLIGVTGYALAYFEELNKLAEQGLVEWGATTISNREEAPDQVAFLKAAGVPIYDDYGRMLEEEAGRLDWVCIPTAIAWHRRMTEKALSLGLPVLLEKPVAPTLQDVAAIQGMERDTGLPVAIGYQHNYIDSTWEIKQRLLDGAIGQIQRIDSICLWPRPRSYYMRNNWGGRLHDGKSWVLDSPLHNAISHVVNLILFLAGKTLSTRADITRVTAELYRAKPIENFDTLRSEVELDSGFPASVVMSHSTRETINPEVRITGTKGTLLWSYYNGHILKTDDMEESWPEECQIRVREKMFENVARLMAGESDVRICSVEQAKGEVKWVNAVQDAAPIHDIPKEYCSQHEDGLGETYDTVDGLDTIARQAYEEQCSFKDLGAPWAMDPVSLETTNYNAFSGNFATVTSNKT